MPTLPNILPTAAVAAFQNNEAAGFAGSSVNHGEAFDQMMTRALAPVKSENDSPPQIILPAPTKAQTTVADLPSLTNPATAAAVAVVAPDFLPVPGHVKTAASRTGAEDSKSSSHHAADNPALTVPSDDKTAAAPLPLEIIVVPPSVPAEVNPAATAPAKPVSTTNTSGQSVRPTAGKFFNPIGSASKNIGVTGTPTVSLPMVAASSKAASDDVPVTVANSITELSPTQKPAPALPTAKNIPVAPAKISTPDAAPNGPVASPPTARSINPSGNNYFTVGLAPVPSTPAVVSPKAAVVAGALVETLPTAQPIPTAPTTKNIPVTATTVSSPNATPAQTVANPNNLTPTETATTDDAVSAPVADINAITASVVATETLPVPVVIPVAAQDPTVTNLPTEKATAKIGANSAEKTAVASISGKNPADSGVVAKVNVDAADDAKTSAAEVTTTMNTAANVSEDDSKSAKTADKIADDKPAGHFSQPTLFTTPTTPNADAKTAAPIQSTMDGTSPAKQDGLVSDGEKSNKIAGSTGKILPGSGAPMMRGNDLPVRTEQFATTAATLVTTQDSPSTTTAAVERAGSPAVDDLNLQTMERTHELVALHAMRVSDVGTGALQVVIKPGAGTQLSLELRQRGDGIEAQAVLQQGDFKHLNQHWPELQQRLEQRGIKLASLTDDGIASQNNSGSGGGRFEQKPNQSVEAFAEYAAGAPVRGTFVPATATRVTTHAGWETWA